MPLSFGTDGIRGRALEELNAELAYRLGQAIAEVFDPPAVVLGMDTRESSPLLAYSLANGLNARGVDVLFAGVVSTPMIALYSRNHTMIGVMITASHNPFTDNGIKVFKNGEKTREADERKLEAFLTHGTPSYGPYGRFTYSDAIEAEYLTLLETIGLKKTPFRILYDSAHGANYRIAPMVMDKIATSHTQLGGAPDGKNINRDCGSTHVDHLVKTIQADHYDFGFSFDGDGDRVLLVGGDGTLYDGDMILYLLARSLKDKGQLNHDTVVLTKMSNPGLLAALRQAGITPMLTDVGDKYVYAALIEGDYVLGGEASGHIILRHLFHSGDGLLVAVVITQLLAELNQPLDSLFKDVTIYPLRTTNLANIDKTILTLPHVKATLEKLQAEHAHHGLILVRPSGTENKIRITVSFKDSTLVDQMTEDLVNLIRKEG